MYFTSSIVKIMCARWDEAMSQLRAIHACSSSHRNHDFGSKTGGSSASSEIEHWQACRRQETSFEATPAGRGERTLSSKSKTVSAVSFQVRSFFSVDSDSASCSLRALKKQTISSCLEPNVLFRSRKMTLCSLLFHNLVHVNCV